MNVTSAPDECHVEKQIYVGVLHVFQEICENALDRGMMVCFNTINS